MRIKVTLQMRKESASHMFSDNGLSSVNSVSVDGEKSSPPGTVK